MSSLPPLGPGPLVPGPMVPIEPESYKRPRRSTIEGEAPPRIPNFAHAVLLLLIAFVVFVLAQGVLVMATGAYRDPKLLEAIAHKPRYILAIQAVLYLGTLGAAWQLFPLLWLRSFADGLQWNGPKAIKLAAKIIPLGIALSWVVQALTRLITLPDSMPMDEFFRNRTDVWLITVFGTLLAPAVEEICFRGFLFPAFAIAYDWLSLPRTPEAILRWRSTTTLTTASYFFSGFLTSVLFAWLHAAQLADTWAAVALLLGVSFLFTFVRVRTQSVACSTLLHASYNFSVFLTAFVATGGYRHLEKMTR